GPWLYGAAVMLLLALLVAILTKWQFDFGRLLRIGAMTTLVYVCVTIPAHKTSFVGAIVPCIIFFLFIGATSFLIRRLSEKTKNGAIVFLLVAVSIFSISVFKWHWYWRSGGQSEAEPALVSEQRKKLVVDVAQEIASQRKGDTTVFFTTITQYFN